MVNVIGSHTAYRLTVPPHVAVRFITASSLVYVAELSVDHPKKLYPVRVNVFADKFLDMSYVCELSLIVPLPSLALYFTEYVHGAHPAYSVVLEVLS